MNNRWRRKTMKELKNIANTNELIQYLEKKCCNHKFYYHYTNWENFEKIMEYGTFLLTRGNARSINDQHEAKMKGNYNVWDRTYIASFSFGSSENIAMWGLYGLPRKDAIRICIPKAEMIEWLNSIEEISVWDESQEVDFVNDFEKTLTDIIYIYGKKNSPGFTLTHSFENATKNNSGEFLNFDELPEMTGYIKNYAWRYENEVRLKIKSNLYLGCEKICLHLPQSLIDSITITTGPGFVRKNSILLRNMENEGRVFQSGFSQLVNLRDSCTYCDYTFSRSNNG